MNPMIEYYKSERDENGEFISEMTVKERSKKIAELQDAAVEGEIDEFLEWVETSPLSKEQLKNKAAVEEIERKQEAEMERKK